MKKFVCSIVVAVVLLMVNFGFSAEKEESLAGAGNSVYMFSFFQGNGEDGLHLAYSLDGMEWKALNGNKSYLKPEVGTKLMRDPSVCRGPDGEFHMVWTSGWWDKGIGIAHSKDLVKWSEQKFLPLMWNEGKARNCWAPEMFYDDVKEEYVIFWSTTIEGRFPVANRGDDNNNRIYYITTKDFSTYTNPAVLYDHGFNVIDSYIVKDGDKYVMFLKDERKKPVVKKNIRVAIADNATGPYLDASEPITGKYWAEGPAAVKIKGNWFVYFDIYTERRYGGVTSRDLQNWTDISDKIKFPGGTKHGTVFEVDKSVLASLRSTEE